MDRAEQVAFNTPPNDRTLAIGEDKVLKETHMVFLKKFLQYMFHRIFEHNLKY